MASLNVPAPAAVVGGAGTAASDLACAADDVPVAVLAWALQDEGIGEAVDAPAAAGSALAERLHRIQCVGLGKSPEAAAAHVAALRLGATAGTTRLEREYAALFEPMRAVRSRLTKTFVRGDFAVGPPCPKAAELRTGRHVPAAAVTALLSLEPATISSACDAVAAGVAAAEGPGAVLLDVYDGMDMSPDAAAARLRLLAFGGAEATGLTSPATPTEAAYASHFERMRDFRAAVAAVFAREGVGATALVDTAVFHAGSAASLSRPPFKGVCATTLRGHGSAVLSLVCLLDGRLASGSFDKTVKVWDLLTESCVATLSGHTGHVYSLACLPDGRLASGSSDNTVKVWDVTTGSCIATLCGHTGEVYSLVCLPDGRLASGSGDKTVKVWDMMAASCIATLSGHSYVVHSLVCLPDASLASGSWDISVKVWDVATGSCAMTLTGHTDWVYALVCLSDGRLASGSDDCTVMLWE